MSEPFQPESLSPFEARLAQLSPKSAQVDRDEVLFQAGRQAAYAEQRGARRKWYVACSALAATVCAQAIWIYGSDVVPKVASFPPEPPRAVESGAPTPEPPANIIEPPPREQFVQTNPPSDAAPSSAESFWSAFLTLSATERRSAGADSLSVGSSVRGTLRESFVVPKLGGFPSQEPTPLSSRNSDWSPE